jgi:hypothetical protein
MLPSTEQVAENIRTHCEAMAREIARRVEAAGRAGTAEVVEVEALAVLLDWMLGDWFPGKEEGKLSEGDSNIQAQGD